MYKSLTETISQSSKHADIIHSNEVHPPLLWALHFSLFLSKTLWIGFKGKLLAKNLYCHLGKLVCGKIKCFVNTCPDQQPTWPIFTSAVLTFLLRRAINQCSMTPDFITYTRGPNAVFEGQGLWLPWNWSVYWSSGRCPQLYSSWIELNSAQFAFIHCRLIQRWQSHSTFHQINIIQECN